MLLIPGRRLVLGLRWRIGQSEDVIRQPSLEPLVVCELLEELHVVVKHGSHHALQGLVMLDPGVLPVGSSPGRCRRAPSRRSAATGMSVALDSL